MSVIVQLFSNIIDPQIPYRSIRKVGLDFLLFLNNKV